MKSKKRHQTKCDFLCLHFRFMLPIISALETQRHKEYLLPQIHYFLFSCQGSRQHKNKHEKYVFAMFLYSVNGLLIQHSLNQTIVKKCFLCGLSLSLSSSCNWKTLMRSTTSPKAFSWHTYDLFKSFDLSLTNSGALIFEIKFTHDKQIYTNEGFSTITWALDGIKFNKGYVGNGPCYLQIWRFIFLKAATMGYFLTKSLKYKLLFSKFRIFFFN